jgi:hypothetical protein
MTKFKDIIELVKFGTPLYVDGEFSKKLYFDRTWEFLDRSYIFPLELLSADVTLFSVKDGKLYVSVVEQEEE